MVSWLEIFQVFNFHAAYPYTLVSKLNEERRFDTFVSFSEPAGFRGDLGNLGADVFLRGAYTVGEAEPYIIM